MSVFELTYDPEARAAYIRLTDAMIVVTREVTENVLLDLDVDGNLVGVEILNVTKDPR